MKRHSNITKIVWPCCIITVAICQGGCSRPSTKQTNSSATRQVARVLSPSVAGELAAKLANDECDRHYRKRPFTAEQHAAVLEGDVYRWGRLDPGGQGGF